MTRDTETLMYNIRMIVDTAVESEPRAWLISKVNRISPNGICRITLAQDTFDQHNDYIEKDSEGNIIGMWANYYNNKIIPEPIIPDDTSTPSSIKSVITCSGKSIIKIGGSAKTFTLTYYDEEGNISDYTPGYWALWIDNKRVPNAIVEYIETDDPHKLKIKFLGDDSYIGKILKIRNTSDDVVAELDVEIIAL